MNKFIFLLACVMAVLFFVLGIFFDGKYSAYFLAISFTNAMNAIAIKWRT